MKAKDLRNDSIVELNEKLNVLRKKHMEFRFQQIGGTLNNPIEIRGVKRDISRIITIIGEKKNEK